MRPKPSAAKARATKISLAVRAERLLLQGTSRLPRPVINGLTRFTPKNSDGEHLDPLMWATCKVFHRVYPRGLYDPDPVVARRMFESASVSIAEDRAPFTIDEDLLIDGPGGPIPATRYRAGASSLGVVIFFHGGGFTQGSRATHESTVRMLAIDAGVDVLSVEYRLAPEAPYPAALDDAMAAWHFVVDHAVEWGLSPDKICVAGDSAGGNLAAVLAQQTRDHDVVPALQLLIYPWLDLAAQSDSVHEFADGYFLTKRILEWLTSNYVPEPADRADPAVSPLRAKDLSGLPPAYIVAAGWDTVRDEAVAYAEKLHAAGVPVTLDRAGSMIHGFFNMTMISPVARDSPRRAASAVVAALR